MKMGKKKYKLQALIFEKKHFDRYKVRVYVKVNNFVIDKRLRKPIMSFDKSFKVRQRNPGWFNKKTFKIEILGKGIKGVYGLIK